MTLIQVVDSARAILNEPLDSSRTFPDNSSSFWTDAILTTYANLVQEEVQQEIMVTFENYFVTQARLNISANVAAYSLPANFIKMVRLEDIRNSASIEIIPVTINDKQEHVTNFISGVSYGNSYYLVGNRVILTDTPTFTDSSAYQLHYEKKITDLATASDVSEIPLEHHGVLVWGVVKYAMYQQQSDATFAQLEFQKRMDKLKDYAENRQVQRSRKVKSKMGDYMPHSGVL